MINDNFGLKNKGYSNFESTAVLPRQRWYFYKEGFSSDLVKLAVEKLSLKPDDYVFDPFNGSGTTTLTASLLGVNSIGIEVNPFTSFLSETKLSSIKANILDKHIISINKGIKQGCKSQLEGFSTFTETSDLNKWLFNTNVLRSFEGGWKKTQEIRNDAARKVIQLALITAGMENCNAKKDGKGLKYKLNWKELNFDNKTFHKAFENKITQIQEDLNSSEIIRKATIINQDVRSYFRKSNNENKFRLCITSPPYLNTFDYTDIYRAELFLGRFVRSKNELYKLRFQTLRSHVPGALWNKPIDSDFGSLYSESIRHVCGNPDKLMHKHIPLMIQAYFEDMKTLLSDLKSGAAPGAQIWIVVSNSAYANKEIPVDLILGDIGSQIGLYLSEIGVLRYIRRRKTKHSPDINELRESVIIFDVNKPK